MVHHNDDYPILNPGHEERAHKPRPTRNESFLHPGARALLAISAVGLTIGIIADKGEDAPSEEQITNVLTCAQEGLSQVALNGYEITRLDVVANVNNCESDEGIILTEEQHTTLISSLEATN